MKHICQVITSRFSHIQTQSSKEIMREKKSLSLLLENTIRFGGENYIQSGVICIIVFG